VTPLQTAAEKGRVDLARLLLGNGAAIDAVGFEDCVSGSKADEAGTALHFAMDAGSVEVARLLLENGADVRLRDFKGRTGRERAEEKRMEGIVQFLSSFSID
jgi:ankyrin repeat protein